MRNNLLILICARTLPTMPYQPWAICPPCHEVALNLDNRTIRVKAHRSNCSLDTNNNACESTALIICADIPYGQKHERDGLTYTGLILHYLIPADETFRLEYANQKPDCPFFRFRRWPRGVGKPIFFFRVTLRRTRLNTHFGHDIRIRNLSWFQHEVTDRG